MKVLTIIWLCLLLASCNSERIDPENVSTLVVEGYLYVNQPLEGLRVSRLIPFNAQEGESFTIDDATVEVTRDTEVFQMEARGDGSGLYDYLGPRLAVGEGDEYVLELRYEGLFARAVTIVPPAPSGLSISNDRIEQAPITSFADLRNLRDVEPVEIVWDNPSGDYYYVLVENIEENPVEISQLDLGGGGNFSLITEPTNLDRYPLRRPDITQYGRYRVVLYRVNQEYVDLYQTSEQDSRNLTEPLTNVESGLGIFTSFNSDTLYFEIVEP